MEQVDCIVVGAGVIGLAIARKLALSGRDVLVIEANGRFGAETSSRNNEVIHAGFLYTVGSLKARLCRTGRDQLYRYCNERAVAHRRIGKLMIATSASELSVLRSLAGAAKSFGVEDLVWLESEAAREREPNLACLAALHSPSTGIVDAHGLMLALLGDAESAGATVVYRTRVTGGAPASAGVAIETLGDGGATTAVHCRSFVNAAGLGARDLAMWLRGGLDDIPAIDFAKGNFFSYSGALPFSRLIVPLGDTLAAGAAFTIDNGGQGKFGPDLEWATQVDYSVAPDRAATFVTGIRRFFSDVDVSRLAPNFSGIRPRVRNANGLLSDWLILGPAEHGLQGVFHLLGFDTPGLTACLAVADYVAAAINNTGEYACRTRASSE